MYRPVNHFRELLQIVQAQEAISIDRYVIDLVRNECSTQPLILVNAHSPHAPEVYQHVKALLRSRHLHVYLYHIPKIVSLATGQMPPQWTKEQVDYMCRVFERIDAARKNYPTGSLPQFPMRFLLEQITRFSRIEPAYVWTPVSLKRKQAWMDTWSRFVMSLSDEGAHFVDNHPSSHQRALMSKL